MPRRDAREQRQDPDSVQNEQLKRPPWIHPLSRPDCSPSRHFVSFRFAFCSGHALVIAIIP
jgi:hypothetical protein